MLQRAVFLDRDGVINRALVREGKPYAPRSLAEFELLPGVKPACQRLRDAGLSLVVVTNQPDVGRGTLSREAVEQMHASMCRELPIDRVEVCYHSGREVPPCACRKPLPGMLLKAALDLGLDLPGSYMVGDRWRDVECGAAVGCTTLFVDHGYDEPLRQPPHYRVASLVEASALIVRLVQTGAPASS